MKLNLKISHIQVKRPIKINKYHLKSWQETLKKIPSKKRHKSEAQLNKKRHDVKLWVIYYEIPNTQIPHHVATSRLSCDKIETTGFCKTRDNRVGNLRTDSSNESQWKWIKMIFKWRKNACKTPMKKPN